MKILHAITTLGVGGAEKHLLMLAGGQRRRGHTVHVAYLKGEGELTVPFEEQGVIVERLHPVGEGGGGLSALLAARGRLARLVARLKPDLVHTHLLKADALGAISCGRVPVIASKHNDERALLRLPVSVVHGLLSRRVARTIALSDHVAAFIAEQGRVSRERITRIYYGIDPAALQPRRSRAAVRAELKLPESAQVLVCVGRLAPQKDHPTLLAALARLPPEVVLLLVGGDPFGDGEARLRRVAAELRLGERARFLGIRHDVPDLLAASDLFVLPSLWEGLGLVFLEAMAVGLPVVATTVSAIPEVIEDGQTGWLVPPGDPDRLAATIAQALADPRERERRGRLGRQRLDGRFGLERMLDEVLAVYSQVLR